MLEELYSGISTKFPEVNLQSQNWDILRNLWKQSSISFTNDGFFWHIVETIEGEVTFKMNRSVVNKQRLTEIDKYGLLGVSLLNLQDKLAIITEGVSDYFTAKLLCPDRNVLGITTLGGSINAKKILLSLFDSVLICADNDATGMLNATKWKRFLTSYNKSASVFIPPQGKKDITDAFVFNLKLAYLK